MEVVIEPQAALRLLEVIIVELLTEFYVIPLTLTFIVIIYKTDRYKHVSSTQGLKNILAGLE